MVASFSPSGIGETGDELGSRNGLLARFLNNN
jgi:hypothetical protein